MTDAEFYATKALAISRNGRSLTKGEHDLLTSDTPQHGPVSRRFQHDLDGPVMTHRDFA